MTKRISTLWLLGPPLAIFVTAFVYYAKFGSVRHWVDTRFPWVEEHIGNHLPSRAEASGTATAARRTAPQPPSPMPRELVPEPPRPAVPPVAPSFFAPDGTVDVLKLAADRNAWPPVVALKKAHEFPAVVDGKLAREVHDRTLGRTVYRHFWIADHAE